MPNKGVIIDLFGSALIHAGFSLGVGALVCYLVSKIFYASSAAWFYGGVWGGLVFTGLMAGLFLTAKERLASDIAQEGMA